MKNLFLITLMLIPFLGISQTRKPVDGFLGIKFSSSKATVVAAMKAKGASLQSKEKNSQSLAFLNVTLGHRTGGLVVKFINDKAYEAVFIFDPGFEAKTIEYYYSLVNDINENYGTGLSSATFKDPYSAKDDDSDKITAIQNADANYITNWKSEIKNSIQAYISEDLTVLLVYEDANLSNEAEQVQKAKEKSDY
jgi:hypothetical protein